MTQLTAFIQSWNKQALEVCLQHSNNPTLLKRVLTGTNMLKVYIGIPVMGDDACNKYTVSLKRNEIRVTMKYKDSPKNTANRKLPTLYDILVKVGLHYHCAETWSAYKDEMALEDTPINHHQWMKLRKLSRKLQSVITPKEAESLPI